MPLSASPNGTTNGLPTYTQIQTITHASSQPSFTFSSIPQTYNNLIITGKARGTDASSTLELLYQVNGQTGNYYDGTYIRGTGSGNTSSLRAIKFINPTYAGPIGTMVGNNAEPGFFSTHKLTWIDYSNTSTYKSVLAENGAMAGIVSTVATGTSDLSINMYFATLAISSIVIFPASGQFASGSTFTLYGEVAA